MPDRFRYAPLALVLCVLVAPSSRAQLTTGRIFGTVRDGTGAFLQGASVTLESTALFNGQSEGSTNARGEFRFVSLLPGSYALKVRNDGFQSYLEEDIRIEVGVSLERQIVLVVGLEEGVTVTGNHSDLDTRRSGFSASFGSEMQEQIPRLRTDFMDFVRMAPGMSATQPTSYGLEDVSALGSGVNENLILIDGNNETDPDTGRWMPFLSTDAVQEVEILSNGASAEFGNYQGAVINIVTRRGGNDWSFTASYYHQSQGLAAAGPTLPCACPSEDTGFNGLLRQDATAQGGGRLWRDRAWVFGSFQYRRVRGNSPGSDPDFVNSGHENRFFEKLTLQATPRWTIQQTYQDGGWRYPDGADATFPAEVGVTWTDRGPVLGVGSTYQLNPTTLFDATFTGRLDRYRGEPTNGSLSKPFRFDLATSRASGGSYMFYESWTDRFSVNAKLTHYADELFGQSHEIKLGTQFTDGSIRWVLGYPGGVRYWDRNGEPFEAEFTDTDTVGGSVSQFGLFLEDVVEMGERLTVNLGLRYDRNHVTSTDVPAINSSGVETGGTISGLGDLFTWNVVAPRVGFTLALDRTRQTVLRASWGRFFQGAFIGEFTPFHPGQRPVTTARYDAADGAYTNVVDVFNPNDDLTFNADIRAPRTEQLSVGLERELFGDIALGVSYVRKSGELFTGWEDIAGVYGIDTATLPDGRTVTVLPRLSEPSDSVFELTNPDSFYLKYYGWIFTFQKRWAQRWQLSSSYTLSRSKGLQSSSLRLPGGIQDSSGGLFGGFDPNRYINADGDLPNDRRHMFRVQGSVHIPRIDVLVGGSYQLVSGAAWAATAFVPLPQGMRIIYIEPRGTRRLPRQNLFDLRVSKIIPLGSESRLELMVDILNTFNDETYDRVATTNFFSPVFAEGRRFIEPRRAMLAVRWSF